MSALALVAGLLVHLTPRAIVLPQDPGGLGLGPYQTTPGLSLLAGIVVVGGLLAFRFRALAYGVLLVATCWLAFLVLAEFRYVVGVLVLATAVPTALLANRLFDRSPNGERPSSSLLVVVTGIAVTVAVLGGLAGRARFLDLYGPTHPESNAANPDWLADWMWVGGVQPTSATIVAGGLPAGPHQLTFTTDSTGSTGSTDGLVIATADGDGIARFELVGLEPDSSYRYRIGAAATGGVGEADSTFRTPAVGPQDLTIVVGSCARTGSNGAVFDAILDEEPDLFVALGDLHYANLVSDEPADHIEVLGRSLSTPAQSALFSSVPSAWVWDDHDYGDNDSDSTSPARAAVSAAYRQAVPHYGVDPSIEAPISQAFTLGRVRFVVADTRSMRTADTMLGDEQLSWLIEELTTSAASHALVVWANPAPWISDGGAGSDQWGGFDAERAQIANAIAEAGITNLVMVSGDYHLVAIDDGTNSGFSDNGDPGFPVLQAGPLDRPARLGGGPYSHGAFVSAGQYGKLSIIDDGGSTIGVTLSGHSWDGATLTTLDLDIAVGQAATVQP